MYLTANLKGHITISVMANAILELLPIKPSMTFPMKYSLMTLTFYRSCGLRRKHHAKIVYTCCDTCHPARGNLANEDSLLDNENIALAFMKSRDERVTIKDALPSSNTFAAAALRLTFTHSSERPQHPQESLVVSMGSGYPAVVQRAPKMVSSLRATVEPGAQRKPSGVDPNDES